MPFIIFNLLLTDYNIKNDFKMHITSKIPNLVPQYKCTENK